MPPQSVRDPEALVVSRRDALRALGIAGAVLMLGGVAACTGSAEDGPITGTGLGTPPPLFSAAPIPTASPSRPVPAPTSIRDVTAFGAVGDGRTDDTAAIKRALSAMTGGQALRFPAGGVFCHAEVLLLSTADVQLLGPGTLLATNEAASALQLGAPNITVDGLTLAIQKTTRRWTTPDQHKLVLGPYEGIVVRDVTVTGSAAAGVFCFGASNFLLQRVQVSNTRADGIHMTGGSSNGLVDSPVLTHTGDDAVAVVSYLNDASSCHTITVTAPRVNGTAGGRGLSVVGGQDISFTDIQVASSNDAGVYIACERSFSGSRDAVGVRVTGGTVTASNVTDAVSQGAVFVYSGRKRGQVRDVVISDLQISRTHSNAGRQLGARSENAGSMSDVHFVNIALQPSPTPYIGSVPSNAVSLSGVTAGGKLVSR